MMAGRMQEGCYIDFIYSPAMEALIFCIVWKNKKLPLSYEKRFSF